MPASATEETDATGTCRLRPGPSCTSILVSKQDAGTADGGTPSTYSNIGVTAAHCRILQKFSTAPQVVFYTDAGAVVIPEETSVIDMGTYEFGSDGISTFQLKSGYTGVSTPRERTYAWDAGVRGTVIGAGVYNLSPEKDGTRYSGVFDYAAMDETLMSMRFTNITSDGGTVTRSCVGDSGGPLFNPSGALAGVLSSGYGRPCNTYSTYFKSLSANDNAGNRFVDSWANGMTAPACDGGVQPGTVIYAFPGCGHTKYALGGTDGGTDGGLCSGGPSGAGSYSFRDVCADAQAWGKVITLCQQMPVAPTPMPDGGMTDGGFTWRSTPAQCPCPVPIQNRCP